MHSGWEVKALNDEVIPTCPQSFFKVVLHKSFQFRECPVQYSWGWRSECLVCVSFVLCFVCLSPLRVFVSLPPCVSLLVNVMLCICFVLFCFVLFCFVTYSSLHKEAAQFVLEWRQIEHSNVFYWFQSAFHGSSAAVLNLFRPLQHWTSWWLRRPAWSFPFSSLQTVH